MKFYGALGDVELAGDFFGGKIFEQRVQDFLLAAAEIGDGIGFEAAALIREDGIDEPGQDRARDPETSAGNQRQGTDQLIAGFGVSKKTFHAEAQQLIAVGVAMLFTDDD